MNVYLKTAGYGIMGIFFYINSNFGEAFYVLAGLLLVDALLNYKDEAVYLQKLMVYLVSAGSAFYVQNASMAGIPLARGLIVALALHELAQVTIKATALLQAYKATCPTAAPEIDMAAAQLAQLATLITTQLNTQAAAQAVPQAVTATAAQVAPTEAGPKGE